MYFSKKPCNVRLLSLCMLITPPSPHPLPLALPENENKRLNITPPMHLESLEKAIYQAKFENKVLQFKILYRTNSSANIFQCFTVAVLNFCNSVLLVVVLCLFDLNLDFRSFMFSLPNI